MKNIALIGASGFVGTRLLELLSREKFHLLNIDKAPSHFYPSLTRIANVLDKESLKTLLQGYEAVVMLAAEHRDDVSPVSLYYEVNVQGMRNTLEAMEACGVKRLVFTSSVAVYGLNKDNPSEVYPADPFNHYGKSKWEAEKVLQAWYEEHPDWSIQIVRPTVIFGERNRGNVYNLLRQIAGGKFLMVGKGNNRKSMAYVGNVVAFIRFLLVKEQEGYHVYNYVDKPDLTMNDLVSQVSRVLKSSIPTVHFPYMLGILGGYMFDGFARLTGRKLTVSSVRVKKFCATTQFEASKMAKSGFVPPYTLEEGLARTLEFEFIHKSSDDIVFRTE